MRQRMKALQLGVNYGMGVPSLAHGIDRHPLIASGIIERHRRTYPRFWEWRADMVQTALLELRDAAAGGVATVRGRHCAGHVDSRRHPS
jgi:DNA polymerase I-like protein with 3'-5' exonuclease and polymerase domains